MGFFSFKKILELYKDRWSAWLINIWLAAAVASAFLFWGKDLAKTDLAALHYNIYSGINLLGPWQWLWILPIVLFILAYINLIIAGQIIHKYRVWVYWLLLANLVNQLIMFIYLYNILNFNRHA